MAWCTAKLLLPVAVLFLHEVVRPGARSQSLARREVSQKKTSLGGDASCHGVLAEILIDLNALDLKMSAKPPAGLEHFQHRLPRRRSPHRVKLQQ